jgi:hypothetical protein
MKDDEFDLERLRVDPTKLTKPMKPTKKAKPKKWTRQFVRVPWGWVEKLGKTKRVSTYRLALLLLYEYWRKGDGKPLVLSNVLAAEVELSRQTKWLGLNELKELGLVRFEEKRKGCAPRVVLEHV